MITAIMCLVIWRGSSSLSKILVLGSLDNFWRIYYSVPPPNVIHHHFLCVPLPLQTLVFPVVLMLSCASFLIIWHWKDKQGIRVYHKTHSYISHSFLVLKSGHTFSQWTIFSPLFQLMVRFQSWQEPGWDSRRGQGKSFSPASWKRGGNRQKLFFQFKLKPKMPLKLTFRIRTKIKPQYQFRTKYKSKSNTLF